MNYHRAPLAHQVHPGTVTLRKREQAFVLEEYVLPEGPPSYAHVRGIQVPAGCRGQGGQRGPYSVETKPTLGSTVPSSPAVPHHS
ncbi:unnamed protein product [Gadus morhua 'NCC']